ncbi:hypothetical protein EDB83DRAFT_2311743 [Lactarius deliciosus]|nr:hypothetical protein EDB83DRAFT_2311743 [Lactarius deliciosus]
MACENRGGGWPRVPLPARMGSHGMGGLALAYPLSMRTERRGQGEGVVPPMHAPSRANEKGGAGGRIPLRAPSPRVQGGAVGRCQGGMPLMRTPSARMGRVGSRALACPFPARTGWRGRRGKGAACPSCPFPCVRAPQGKGKGQWQRGKGRCAPHLMRPPSARNGCTMEKGGVEGSRGPFSCEWGGTKREQEGAGDAERRALMRPHANGKGRGLGSGVGALLQGGLAKGEGEGLGATCPRAPPFRVNGVQMGKEDPGGRAAGGIWGKGASATPFSTRKGGGEGGERGEEKDPVQKQNVPATSAYVALQNWDVPFLIPVALPSRPHLRKRTAPPTPHAPPRLHADRKGGAQGDAHEGNHHRLLPLSLAPPFPFTQKECARGHTTTASLQSPPFPLGRGKGHKGTPPLPIAHCPLPFPLRPRHPVHAGKGGAHEGHATPAPPTTPPCTRGEGACKGTRPPAPPFSFAREGARMGGTTPSPWPRRSVHEGKPPHPVAPHSHRKGHTRPPASLRVAQQGRRGLCVPTFTMPAPRFRMPLYNLDKTIDVD